MLTAFIWGAFSLYGMALPLVGLALVVWLGMSPGVGSGAATVGALLGAAVLPVLIGIWNIDGPAMICTHTATEGSCTQELSPIPWFTGAALLIVGAAARLWFARRRRA